jgi:hypothetical protein
LYIRNETFETLLEDGYMIPTKEQLNAIGILAEGIYFYSNNAFKYCAYNLN